MHINLQRLKRLLLTAISAIFAASAFVPVSLAAPQKFESLVYLYGGTTDTYLHRMEKTGDCISVVSPDYYETAADGSVIYTKLPDPVLISTMQAKSIKVTPFVSNHWDRANARAMLEKRAEAAEFLAASVEFYGLDGLDIDIQNINEADRDNFVDFIRLLREAMPDDASLTVCVAANPYQTTIGWQGGYDYKKLSKHCDHVFMMTYDESYNGSEPGPVASLDFIKKSIDYGLLHVPSDKLMMGIPFYGRFWTDSVKGVAWTVNDIEHLVSVTGAEPWFDEQNCCARVTITVPEDSNVKTWGGSKVLPGVYDVWYENQRSYELKLALVKKYGLRGVGSWALGQEPSWMWTNYSAWLNGLRFNDIESHWAQSFILTLFERGVINGKTEYTFEPESNLTRAEAAALLARLAGLDAQNDTIAFSDTAEHWANGVIAAAKSGELVFGVTADKFEPDRLVTREEFAVMADRYTNITDALDLTQRLYTDMSPVANPWSNAAIIKLSVNGVLGGYADGRFRPRGNITRAEAAKVIALLSNLPTRFVKDDILPLERGNMGPR